MRKKIFVLGLSLCLFAAACNGKNAEKENIPEQEGVESTGTGETDGVREDETAGEESSGKKTEDDGETSGKELSKAPEVTFTDYSQTIQDDDGSTLLLSVTENCPVITIEENKEAARKMNLVFEQQHETNQEDIQKKAEEAGDIYHALTGEEAAAWTGYEYGMSYKVVSSSTRILSLVAQSYDWQGGAHPNTWSSAYCFDASSGNLLYLADIFTDEVKAREIVERHILDTLAQDTYKDKLLEDYKDYVADILTENTFYLNEKGLVVICNPYMVTEYAAGTIEVEVPYAEIEDVMNGSYVLN